MKKVQNIADEPVTQDDFILKTIQCVKTKIPGQGPLEFFVHHNTLHHYESYDFFDAVKMAARDYQTNAFMPESYYWEQYEKQRISTEDILSEIQCFLTKHRFALPIPIVYRLLMQKDTQNHCLHGEEIRILQEKYTETRLEFFSQAVRDHFDIEVDYIIGPHLLKFFSVYYDFGSAYWLLEDRQNGMLHSFQELYSSSFPLCSKYLRTLRRTLIKHIKLSASEIILLLLQDMAVENVFAESYLFELAYRYKGWAGLIKSLETHPQWLKSRDLKSDFAEFLAILLLAEYAAVQMIAKQFPTIPYTSKRVQHSENFVNHFIYERNKHPELAAALNKIFPYLCDFNRQEILHRAFERHLYHHFLDTYTAQNFKNTPHQQPFLYQVICCIDEREESLRRYLEKDPQCQTYGTAGHFDLSINFKGFSDKYERALCPVTIKPNFSIIEKEIIQNAWNIKFLLIYGELQWLTALSSKTLLRGFIALFFGFFAKLIPLTLDIVSPKVTRAIKQAATKALRRSVHTELLYQKEQHLYGMALSDRVRIAAEFLQTMALTQYFSPFIFIVGHGSSSLNNPHEAAYNCGACGGGRGGTNARLMALILNESQVRCELKNRFNIVIPKTTLVIGAYHNTCNDDIHYYDLQEPIINALADIQQRIHQAAELNAKERCRRFSSISKGRKPEYYHKKVQERALDFRQARPEYGHSTNALCIVGPRSKTRNLFLDRRAFLVSYEEGNDAQGSILNALLNSTGLVCAGINLEYYFSYIDNEKYGCGTKLPHNITSLIGVINGYQSDLQLGLSWQMVEIHQPVRLMMFIICRLDTLRKILTSESIFTRLVQNSWVSLAVHNTQDDKIYLHQDNDFILYQSRTLSPSYFRIDNDILNVSHHLEFGYIVS